MEALTEELSLAKAAMEAKEVELANSKASMVDQKKSTSKGCTKCYNHDMDACEANLVKLGKLKQENKILKMSMNTDMFVNEDGFVKERLNMKYPSNGNKSKKG